MYRAKCECGGHVDFKRTKILNVHKCNKYGIELVTTKNGDIYPSYGSRITGYFKVGNAKKDMMDKDEVETDTVLYKRSLREMV